MMAKRLRLLFSPEDLESLAQRISILIHECNKGW